MSLTRIPQGGRVAALRFSSLGDVVLAGAALAELQRQRPDLDIVFVTKATYADLFRGQAGIAVWALDPKDGFVGLWRLAKRLRAWRPDLIADLHATLRAWILRLLLPLTTWRRIRKRTTRRWLTVKFKRPDKTGGHVVARYAAVFGLDNITPKPWLTTTAARTQTLALIPGAAWPTKRWPLERWLAVAAWWQARGGQVLWVGGDAETTDLERAKASAGGELAIAAPLTELADRLAACVAAVANDTGPGHLAAAVGTPVVSILGPTVAGFGFTPWGRHALAETAHDCRPCSLHGNDKCPLGHHRCMLEIAPAQVIAQVESLLAATQTP